MTVLQTLTPADLETASETSGPSAGSPTWLRVCAVSDLEHERGCAALIDGQQVALFLTHDDHIFAVQQLDPYSDAYVMSRGIVGSRGEASTVASPMYKQVFDLRTGVCLDTQGKDPATLRTWPISVDAAGDVFIKWTATSSSKAEVKK